MSLESLSNAWDAAFTDAKGEEVKTATEEAPTDADPLEIELAEHKEEADEKAEAETEKEEGEDNAEENKEQHDKSKGRDYSKFDAADVPFLKQMSRAAFDHIAPKLLAAKDEIAARDKTIAEIRKDLADGKTLPDEWYNDPAAAEASPDFKAIKKDFDAAQTETHRLTDLVRNMRAGRIRYDAESQQFVPDTVAKDEIDQDIISQLEDARTAAYEKQKDLAAKGNNLIENFGKIHQTAAKEVKDSITKLFPWVSDDKHANQPHMKNMLNVWPKVFRSHPAVQLASALAVEHILLKHAFAEELKKNKARAGVKTAARQSGPSSSRNGKAQDGEENRKMKLDDFPGH